MLLTSIKKLLGQRNQSDNLKEGSLTKDTLITMTIRIVGVISVSALISYLHLISNLESQVKEQLRRYIVERARKESDLFLLAEDNHQIFKEEFLRRFEATQGQDPQEAFDQLFLLSEDGTMRIRDEFFEAPENSENTANFENAANLWMTGFIGREATQNLDAELRRLTVKSYEMLLDYGPAWNNRFPDLYVSTPNNVVIVYWPNYRWGTDISADLDLNGEEWVYIADTQNNPERKTAWTGSYYDIGSNEFLVSIATPVDIDGEHVITIGNDILVNDLVNRTISDTLEGTQNIIFREDGRLVAHPDLMEDIKEELGYFLVAESGDENLQHTFNLVTEAMNQGKLVTYNRKTNEFLAVSKIEGPDWYFVTVYPKSLLSGFAFESAQFVLISGLIALAIEVILLYSVMKTKVALPLNELIKATDQVSKGNFKVDLDDKRKDELGRLAKSFKSMATQLQSSFVILEQRVAERTSELETAKVAADTANRAKSEFLANMSHELRTPLNGVLGYAQILQRSKVLPEKEKKGVGIINQCGSHLLTLINDILDLSKIEAQKMELHAAEFHLPSFVQGVAEICRIKAEQKGIQFIYETDGELPDGINTDEKRLRQVLINLLGNAIKFTEQGHVKFLVKSQQSDTNLSKDSKVCRLRFQIEDTGIGMTQEQLEKIFLPFEQVGNVKKQAEGTGLGLAITHKIVEMMDSALEVESQPNKGSIFRFDVEVPEAYDWVKTSTTLQQGMIVGYEGPRRKILVVDDRWENRSVVASLLEPLGFQILEADNGQKGLTKATTDTPDLIVTDLAMPVLDGYEMLKTLREHTESNLNDIPVIVSSASAFESDKDKSFKYGANAFLPKPIQAEGLITSLQSLLELQWVYEKVTQEVSSPSPTLATQSTDLIPPSPEDLEILYSLSRRGLVNDLVKQSEQMQAKNPSSIAFLQHLDQMAKGFKLKEIRDFLEGHLNNSTDSPE